MSNIYGSDVYAYLVRARRQLDARTHDSLFYAAFELRCGIESRLQQYLNARDDIAKRKKDGWRLAAPEKELSKAFRDSRTVVELVVTSQNIPGEARLFHTPVRTELVEAGGRLGNLLHCAKADYDHNDPWWTETRKSVEATFVALELASRGTLLAPPMRTPKGGFRLNAFYHNSNPLSGALEPMISLPTGTNVKVHVQYHEHLPAHAEPFLNRWRIDLD